MKIETTSVPLVFVEGGTYQMGSTGKHLDQKPVHTVSVNSFFIGKYEVTQDIYEQLMGINPSVWKGQCLPVEYLSWYDAIAFCNMLSKKDGFEEVYTINKYSVTCDWDKKGYRLPTEAEWEYAARGGLESEEYLYAGSNNAGNVAWYYDNSKSRPHEVGTREPNELGVYDMSGNVYEWCWDWYGDYHASIQTNPIGPVKGPYRILRGGSWLSSETIIRSTFRDGNTESFRDDYVGFRVVLPSE